jgi:D-lyxose ketol-isomerase
MKRTDVTRYQEGALSRLVSAGITIRDPEQIEIADFGLGEYEKTGLALYVRINEPEYCSKWLVLEPGQTCPPHYHKIKKETFFVVSGRAEVTIGDRTMSLEPGGRATVPVGVLHAFTSSQGAVLEEVSTHDENADSYFLDPRIVREPAIEE